MLGIGRFAVVKLGERWISFGGKGLELAGWGVEFWKFDIVQELYGSVGTRRTKKKNGDDGRCVVLNDRAAWRACSNDAESRKSNCSVIADGERQ